MRVFQLFCDNVNKSRALFRANEVVFVNNLYSTRAKFVSAHIEQSENRVMDASFAQFKISGHSFFFHMSSLTGKNMFDQMAKKRGTSKEQSTRETRWCHK